MSHILFKYHLGMIWSSIWSHFKGHNWQCRYKIRDAQSNHWGYLFILHAQYLRSNIRIRTRHLLKTIDLPSENHVSSPPYIFITESILHCLIYPLQSVSLHALLIISFISVLSIYTLDLLSFITAHGFHTLLSLHLF